MGTKRKKGFKEGRENLVEVKKSKIRDESVRNLRLSLLNVNGYDEVSQSETKEYMKTRRPDVLALVETKLREEQLDDVNLEVEGYSRFEVRRSDLAGDTGGGGIMIYARHQEGLQFKEYRTASLSKEKRYVETERKWLVVKTEQYETAVCAVYLSHQSNDDKYGVHNEGILEVLRKEIGVMRTKGMRCILMGDMNAWVGCAEGVGIPGYRPELNKNGERMISFLEDTNMMHLNGAKRKMGGHEVSLCRGMYTRHDSRSATAIDSICVSREHQRSIKYLKIDEDVLWGGNSDHVFLESNFEDKFVRSDRVSEKKTGKPRWNFDENSDWGDFKRLLDEELMGVEDVREGDVDALGEKLVECLVKSLEGAFGDEVRTKRRSKKFPPDVLLEMVKKKDAKSKWRASRSDLSRNPDDEELRRTTEVLLRRLEEQGECLNDKLVGFWAGSRRTLIKELSERSVATTKKFWSFFRSASKAPADFTVVEDPETGEYMDDPKEVMETIQNFLVKLFEGSLEVPERVALVEDLGPDLDEDGDEVEGLSEESELVLEAKFQEEEVERAIRQLQNGKAEGVDRVPPEALKNSTPKFLKSLTDLFNLVKETGKAPECWKTGRVVLLLKCRPCEELGNYRPLTIIVAVSGLFSRVLNQQLTGVVEKEGFLGEVQQGFRKTRAGSDNLFVLNTILWKSSAQRKKVHLAFVDLKKAYDTVSRQKLWATLRRLGIKKSFLACLQALYSEDRFITEVNGEWTIPIYLGRGLRQGCSLSPILFALYVAEWGEELVNCAEGIKLGNIVVSVLFFADDIILVSSTAEGLHRMLRISEKHSKRLRMNISEKKSQVLSPSSDTWELHDEDGEVATCLEKVATYKYLGIDVFSTMAKTSGFKQSKAIKIARKYQAVILNFSRRGPDIIEMAVVAWRNIAIPSILFGTESILFSDTAIQEVQRVQNQLFKKVLGLSVNTHNSASEVLLSIPCFEELLLNTQLKFYIRVLGMNERRFAYQALHDHMFGGWSSPYYAYITAARMKLGVVRLPGSPKEVQEVTRSFFLDELNERVAAASSLGAIGRITSLSRARHCREGEGWAWISKIRMGATGLRARKGEVWKQLCFSCNKALTEEHVVTACTAVVNVRRRTGVSSFFAMARMRGLSVSEAFSRFVGGLDSMGRQISLQDYEERGKALGAIIMERKKLLV